MRALILESEPEMIEERKWRKPSNGMTGVPVWSHNGIVCTGETYKTAVKLTFARGASIPLGAMLPVGQSFTVAGEGGGWRRESYLLASEPPASEEAQDILSVQGLQNMRLSVGTARRGWCTAADVLNTRPLEELL